MTKIHHTKVKSTQYSKIVTVPVGSSNMPEDTSRGSDFLMVERVSYGKDDTPEEDRDYKLVEYADSPAGTKKEWENFAKSEGFKGMRYVEKDGSMTFHFFDKEEK